jgi:SAM-dependent methyltransferase
MSDTRTYIMEHPREGQRLLDKVDADSWISKFLEPHLREVKSVLSVGCGPGVFLRELAGSHPNVQFVGVDLSATRIYEAELRLRGLGNVRLHVGDAQALPFQSNSFDFIFCRFLMEYLPDKRRALQEMIRVCRGGRKILLQDLDGQFMWHFPEDPELQQAIECVIRHLAITGFDPFVGRKLFHLCFEAGLLDIKVHVDPYHLYAGSADDKELALWQTKLEIARPQLEKILGGGEAALRYTEQFLGYLRRPDTLTYSCLFTVTGIKPGVESHLTNEISTSKSSA